MRVGNEQALSAPCWDGDVRAASYESDSNRAFYQAAVRQLLQGTPALCGAGLDLGCGTGFSTEVLLAEQPQVAWQGVDASAAMLRIARGKPALAGIELCAGQAESLPFADASFDVVVASFA